MLPISPYALAALSGASQAHAAADYSNDGGQTWEPAQLASADITADRTAETRYTGSATLVNVPLGRQGVNTISTILRLRRGLSSVRRGVEWFPAGVYAVSRASADRSGQVSLTLEGLEQVLRDARFPKARVVGPGPADALVDTLVHEALPGVSISWHPSIDHRTTIPRMVSDESRWDLLSSGENADGKSVGIARALAAECYFGPQGEFAIRPTPTIDDPYVWEIGQGAGGVLVDRSMEQNAEGVYNVVSAVGDKGDGSATVGPAYAWDNDPTSLTYAGPDPINDPLWAYRNNRRDIRVRLRYYSSPLLSSVVSAEKAAKSLLDDSLGVQSTLSFNAVCNPALEPGDVIRVEVDPGVWQRHLVDSLRWSLTGSSMDCTTRTTTQRI
jgi:hypothetical protein